MISTNVYRDDLCTIKLFIQQVCIPVGCVPAAHLPYAFVCFPGGVCLVRGGVCLVPGGVCLVRGGGSPWGGVSAWSRGGSPCREASAWSQGGFSLPGVSAWSRGGGLPGPGGACPETPPVNRITDTCKNITLATTYLRPVIICQTSCSPS